MAAMAVASPVGAHDCKCRYFGQSYDQGETVCMRGKSARCAMYLNNSSWKIMADACPQALSPKPQRLVTLSAAPVR